MKLFISLFVLSLALSANGKNLLKYPSVVDLSEHKGKTFFSLMETVIKPSLDEYATEGFEVANGKSVIASLKKVDPKVAKRALSAAGDAETLKQLADDLSENGAITFYDLPQAIADAGVGRGRYDLSTFLALVSGGGVAVQINDDNIAYNVNYGTGETEKDEMTGRSFGEGPNRMALDASDKHYLEILESYVRSGDESIPNFYRSLLEILLNNDTKNYAKISIEGQVVATDFIAVYTAEQNRHLMADLKTHHWDAALLEVTLLSALHGGQKSVLVMFNGELTATTLKQAPGCSEEERVEKKASMVDYWQFSSSTDPESCNRSGINVTRRDFRSLGAAITEYQRENNPELVENVERHFTNGRTKGNLFAQLSEFLINYDTPKKMNKANMELAEDFTAFLMQVKKDANKTSQYILTQDK